MLRLHRDERPLPGWLLRISLAALFCWCLVRFWLDLPSAELLRGDPHHPFRARTAAAPLFLAGFLALFWFALYRPHGTAMRPLALALGLAMTAMTAAHLAAGTPLGNRPELPWLLLTSGAAHVVWGLFGRR